jgi:SRSO17 transposase
MDDLRTDVWIGEFDIINQRVGKHIPRLEMRNHAKVFLHGLVGISERRNSWHLAEFAGYSCPDSLQRLLDRASWQDQEVLYELQDYIVEHLGQEDGVLIADETGFLKKGKKSAGVNRQYSGTAGRIENCQIGVFLAYHSALGTALFDRGLYLPEEWIKDRKRCDDAKIPESTTFQTKPQMAVSMIANAIQRKVPFRWFVADEVYGRDEKVRQFLEESQKSYVIAVACNEQYYLDSRVGSTREHANRLADDQWKRLSCGSGTKGERFYDWGLIEFESRLESGFQKGLLFRKSIENPTEIAYYMCHYAVGTKIEELVRVAGKRWAIESAFEQSKQEVGLAHYEVRSWKGWHRHITLSMFAYAFLEVVRKKQDQAAQDSIKVPTATIQKK